MPVWSRVARKHANLNFDLDMSDIRIGDAGLAPVQFRRSNVRDKRGARAGRPGEDRFGETETRARDRKRRP